MSGRRRITEALTPTSLTPAYKIFAPAATNNPAEITAQKAEDSIAILDVLALFPSMQFKLALWVSTR